MLDKAIESLRLAVRNGTRELDFGFEIQTEF